MLEVFGHPDHVPLWREAAEGGKVDWAALLDGYGCDLGLPRLSVLARDPRGQPRRGRRALDPS